MDIQEPLSFGKEREAAEEVDAKFRWPVITKEIIHDGIKLDTGEIILADTVIISVGMCRILTFCPRRWRLCAGLSR